MTHATHAAAPQTEPAPLFLPTSRYVSSLSQAGNAIAAWAIAPRSNEVLMALEETHRGYWRYAYNRLLTDDELTFEHKEQIEVRRIEWFALAIMITLRLAADHPRRLWVERNLARANQAEVGGMRLMLRHKMIAHGME
jgi:hypothetical protein